MALTVFEKERINKIFTKFCNDRIPPHARDQVKLEYEIRGSEVKLFEIRPHFRDKETLIKSKIARFKKEPDTNIWSLFCVDRNGKWRFFVPYPEDKNNEKLLHEVDEDQTCIFWG